MITALIKKFALLLVSLLAFVESEKVFAQTNEVDNLTGAVEVINTPVGYDGQVPPIYALSLINNTTNTINLFRIPLQGFCKLTLLDSNGVSVKKTKAGETFGFWGDQQALDWETAHVYDGFSVLRVNPKSATQLTPTIRIPQLFEIKASGEYTLRVDLRPLKAATGRSADGAIVQHFLGLKSVSVNVVIAPKAGSN